MSLRRILGLAAGVSLLVSVLVATPASATNANLGPVLTIPGTAVNGGRGTQALDAAVSAACASGAPLGNPRWFSLPADDAGVLRINGQQIDDRNGGKGADPVFPSFVALADPSTDEVLGCGTAPIAVATARPLAAVVWISDADAAAYQTYEMGTPANRLGVQRISASLPSNDSLSSPTPISSLPFEYDGDNARATLDGPALPDPYGCFSEIVGVYGSTVWFRWTATSSGRIQTRVITDGFRGAVVMTDAAGTKALPETLVDGGGCQRPDYDVVAGTTYLIGVAGYGERYYDQPPLFLGGRFHLYVGAPDAPSDPLEVTAVPSTTSIAVHWTSGSSASPTVTGFRVQLYEMGSLAEPVTASVGPDVADHTFTGLVRGHQYKVAVSAINGIGAGPPTDVEVMAGGGDFWGLDNYWAPSNGLDAVVDARSLTAEVTWSGCCGAPVTGWRVARSKADGTVDDWSTVVQASTRSVTVPGLLRSARYRFTVTPITASGDGPSAVVAAQVLDAPQVPAPPRALGAQSDGPDRSVHLHWVAPDFDGQSPVTAYVIRFRPVTPDVTLPGGLTTVAAGQETAIIGSLPVGVPYAFDVTARNAVGESRTVTTTGVAWTLPSPPTGVTAMAGDGSVDLSWQRPADDGGVPIAGYSVTLYRSADGMYVTGAQTPETVTSYHVGGLENGVAYFAAIRTQQSMGGLSDPVRSSVFVPQPLAAAATVPGAPIIKTASGSIVGQGVRLVARWAPPVSDGGSPVLAYRVYVYRIGPGGAVVPTLVSSKLPASHSSWTSTIPILGRYRVDVRAINAVGYSDFSARSNLVVPARVPTAPRIGVATSGVPGGQVTATARWSAPLSDGGTAVYAYRVYAFHMSPSGVVLGYTMSPRLQGTVRSYTMALPTYGWYRFAVRACNGMGYSAFSAKSLRVIGR